MHITEVFDFWPLQDVRSATMYSPLSADFLSVGAEQSLKVSLGFRTTETHGTLLRSGSQVNPPCLVSSFIRAWKPKIRFTSYPLILCSSHPPSTTSSCPWLMAMWYSLWVIIPWGQINGAVMEVGTICLQRGCQLGKICSPFVHNCALISEIKNGTFHEPAVITSGWSWGLMMSKWVRVNHRSAGHWSKNCKEENSPAASPTSIYRGLETFRLH